MAENILFHPNCGGDIVYPSGGTVTNTVTTIKASGKGTCFYGFLYNPNSTVGYLQFFDVALAASITVGTTAPTFTISIAPLLYDKPALLGFKFKNGLHVAFTTTKTGNTAQTTPLDATFVIETY